MIWLLILFLATLYTEFVGYFIHRALHVGALGCFSRMHMGHHDDLYPAGSPMRTDTYVYPKRTVLLRIAGQEWVIPIAVVSLPFLVILYFIGISLLYIAFGSVASIVWAWLGLSYMHKSYHLKDFWMAKERTLGKWYKGVRRLHDIHHHDMSHNYGITFFWFDKLAETFTRKMERSDGRSQP